MVNDHGPPQQKYIHRRPEMLILIYGLINLLHSNTKSNPYLQIHFLLSTPVISIIL